MKRIEEELREAANHVDYEVQMLDAMALLLSSARGPTAMEKAVANACLESFVLHVRNLIDFLYPPASPKPDDILSDHYVRDEGKWQTCRPPRTSLLADAETRVNKLAAHLTYSRLQLHRTWKFSDIRADLYRVIRCFVGQLPPDRVTWFPSAGPESKEVA